MLVCDPRVLVPARFGLVLPRRDVKAGGTTVRPRVLRVRKRPTAIITRCPSSKAGTRSEHGCSRGWSVERPVERAWGTCSLSRVVGAAQHCSSSNSASVAVSKSVFREPRFFRSRRPTRRPGVRRGAATRGRSQMLPAPMRTTLFRGAAFCPLASWPRRPRPIDRFTQGHRALDPRCNQAVEMRNGGYGFVAIFAQ
jgi:hypothetical protein